MADFPHLNDTSFPNLGNVNVYAYKNDFDYTRFVANTRIHLCTVRWNGDYSDVVEFGSDESRDAWFDSLSDTETVTISTPQKLRSDGTVKVPIPFDVACMYNYCYIDIPVITGSDDMVDYERPNGYRRWFFFVNDFAYAATNTTVLTLQLDVWTQYRNHVGISYMLLERGHAPVAATNADEYLSDPINNNRYLLSPDVNYGDSTVARGGEFVPFGNGEKMLCLATTCSSTQMRELTVCTDTGNYFNGPKFSDATDYPDTTYRWQYQYQVDNYWWDNGKSYAGTSVPVSNVLSDNGRIMNNLHVFAVPYSDANKFVEFLVSYAPTFMRTVRAAFVVPRDLANIGGSFSFHDFTVYECDGAEGDLREITLDKGMFGFDERFERFAKLYTSPYSNLEITDNNGKTVTVKIEETSTMTARYVTSYAFPYLRMRAFVDGIGGVGSDTYKWVDLNGEGEREISGADWYRCCFDFSIPTFSLWVDGETEYQTSYYYRTLSNGRAQALTTYHNTVRSANDSYHAVLDESATARDNAIDAANTVRTNAYNDASTLLSDNANLRTEASAITSHNNACATTQTSNAIANHNSVTDATNTQTTGTVDAQNTAAVVTADKENESSVSIANNNNTAVGQNSAISAASSIAGAIGAAGSGDAGGVVAGVAGAALAPLSALVTITQTNANTTVATNANTAVTGASTNAAGRVASIGVAQNSRMCTADNTKATADNNAVVSCNTANTNSSNSRNSANANNDASNIRTKATNTRDTAVSNAKNTRDTRASNGRYNRNAAVAAAQDVLRNSQNGAKYALLDARNSQPVAHGDTSGDPTPEYMRNRGVQIKVRTQSDSAIANAASQFARYGYALSQVWDDCDSLQVMRHFSYWKASDVWVYDMGDTNNAAQLAVQGILTNGVTVWSDADEIGAVNVYDN